MRILMINHFPLEGSGSGTYTKNLAIHLTKLGHEVCIILPDNELFKIKSITNVKLHSVLFTECNSSVKTSSDTLGTSIKDVIPFNFPCFTSHPKSVTTFKDLTEEQLNQYKRAFKKAIEEEIELFKPDIVHGQHVWILPSLAIGYNIPLILTAHGTDIMGIDKWPDLAVYAKDVMDACSAVISISKDNYKLLEDRFPQYKDKFVMMRNGYDPTMFYHENISKEDILSKFEISEEKYKDKKIITFAGKLTNFKGVDILLDAISLYEKKKENILTLIIGDGDERDKLKEQSKNLKTVCFLGNVNQNTLRKLYSISDVNIVPSRREPFGLVALEAMACGTPVIASNEGGLPDFVNKDVGDLVIPENPQDLYNAIKNIFKREDNCNIMEWKNYISKYVRENYAQDTIIKELEDRILCE